MGSIGINSYVEPVYGNDSVDTIKANTNAIHAAGGIAVLNHPNYRWAVNHEMINKVKELKFFEVFNGDKATNNLNLIFNTNIGQNYLNKRHGFQIDFIKRLP
mgnify:CR=1 FL=1